MTHGFFTLEGVLTGYPETTLPDFLAALDAAGMQTYLDAANAQLEAYLG